MNVEVFVLFGWMCTVSIDRDWKFNFKNRRLENRNGVKFNSNNYCYAVLHFFFFKLRN